jgi:septum formation protein
MKIILGSQSTGRRKMMEEMGLEFEVMVSGIDEKAIRFEDPTELVTALAKAKAEALIPRIHEPAILITSDQVTVCEGEIREKPLSEEEAKRFLESYARFPVRTVTAVAATNTKTGKQSTGVDIATVHFSPFKPEEIETFIRSGEAFGLAGAFTIEGERWEKHVISIEGTRDSVIGLPKELTRKLIDEII